MTEQGRNIAVGVTVMVAVCFIGAMIIFFAGGPEFFQRGYVLEIRTDSTHNIKAGDAINLRGMKVGHITAVGFTDNDPRKGVTITARIDHSINLPGNIKVYIFGGGMAFQGAYVELKPESPEFIKDKNGKPLEYIPKDQVTYLTAEVISGSSSLIPPDVTDAVKGLGGAVKSLGQLADNLNKLIAPEPTTAPVATTTTGTSTELAASGPAPVEAGGLKGTFDRLNRTLDAMYVVLGDQKNQTNIKESLANMKIATANAAEAMESLKAVVAQTSKTVAKVDSATTRASDDLHNLTQKLIEDAEKVSQLMMTLNKVASKMDSGEGTAGKLLNDPALYNTLLEMSQGMNKLVTDFDALAKQWKEHGVEMKLK